LRGRREADAAALKALDELKALRDELRKAGLNLRKLVSALNDPAHWRIKPEVPEGYGEQSAEDVQVPDLNALGEKVFEYQQKHYTLRMKLPSLSRSVRETVKRQLEWL